MYFWQGHYNTLEDILKIEIYENFKVIFITVHETGIISNK